MGSGSDGPRLDLRLVWLLLALALGLVPVVMARNHVAGSLARLQALCVGTGCTPSTADSAAVLTPDGATACQALTMVRWQTLREDGEAVAAWLDSAETCNRTELRQFVLAEAAWQAGDVGDAIGGWSALNSAELYALGRNAMLDEQYVKSEAYLDAARASCQADQSCPLSQQDEIAQLFVDVLRRQDDWSALVTLLEPQWAASQRDFETAFALGEAHFQLGDYAAAVDVMQALEEPFPSRFPNRGVNYYIILAQAYGKLGDSGLALENFTESERILQANRRTLGETLYGRQLNRIQSLRTPYDQ